MLTMDDISQTAPSADLDEVLCSPVLIVGSPRSGTTWVQRLLLSHPAIRGGHESNFFSAFAPVLQTFRRGQSPGRLVGLANYWTEDQLLEEIRSLWCRMMTPFVHQSNGECRLVLEKTPEHSMYMPEISQIVPGVRFIHVIRDSRAVVASMLAAGNEEWAKSWAPVSARDATIWWYRYVNAARRFGRTLPPDKYIEVHYEDLLADPVAGLSRLLQFLGLPLPLERVTEIAGEQSFEKQKTMGGTPFDRKGEMAGAGKIAEPPGFFRSGQADSWRRELTLRQKLTVWRYSRKLMAECGYSWGGRV
jgi:hypothetical protein